MNQTALKRLLRYLKPYMGYFLMSLLCAVVSVSLTLLGPVLIGKAVDLIVGKQAVDFAGLGKILTYFALTILTGMLFQWLMALFYNRLTHRVVQDMRGEVFGKLNRVPLKVTDNHPHGDFISRVANDIDQISQGLLQGFSQLFTGIITILGTLGFMYAVNSLIATIVVVITPISLFFASFIAKRSHRQFVEQTATRGEISGFVEEMIGSQKVVKAFGYEQRAQKKFEEINERLYQSGVKSQFYSSVTNPGTRFVNGVVYAAVGIIGAVMAIRGRLAIGQISAFLTYANQYTKPFNEISGVVTELNSAFASAKRVFDALDKEEEKEEKEDAVVMESCAGHVEISDVSFSYRKEQALLKRLNVSAKPGDRIAIVGPTGCGKTTLINLLMRFYDVDKGSILIDGINIEDMTRNSLRQSFGMVLQDTWLFSGTVRENIAYGKPDAKMDEIIAAAKSAHAHSFIKRLSHGYDTDLSEGGGNLSQGQRQLLCIARVMLLDPPMLILDEATSSIDTRTEILVQHAFSKMMEGRTSFIVAHRLSTIKEATTILVMKDGNIIEQGNHKELLNRNGFYAHLYNSQFQTNI